MFFLEFNKEIYYQGSHVYISKLRFWDSNLEPGLETFIATAQRFALTAIDFSALISKFNEGGLQVEVLKNESAIAFHTIH